MPIKMLVACGDFKKVNLSDELKKQIPGVLGNNGVLSKSSSELKIREEAIELKELLDSTLETLKESVQHESKLTVEISGSIRLVENVGGEAKFLILNIGAKTEEQRYDHMRISLETKITPGGKG